MRNRVSILFILAFAAVCGMNAAQFTLTWSDNSTNEAGFRIERASGLDATTGFAEIATVGANVTSYVDAGLPNSSSYTYRLRAYNSAGTSGYSNTASGTTPPPAEVAPNGNPLGLGVVGDVIEGQMVNVSTRAVTSEANPLIGGFVVVGGPVKVLLRGVSPRLAQFGAPDPLADVRLILFDKDGAILAQNDDWTGDDVIAVSAKIGAFTLPVGSKDAAMLITLPPGQYTVHVIPTGASAGLSGTALVEAYKVSLP